MGRCAEQRRGAPLVADGKIGVKGGPVLGPEAEALPRLRAGQREAEERRIGLGFVPVLPCEPAARPDPARLGQFPRFAPIIAAL